MIDWQRVNELRDEIGAESLHEVVELFLDEVEGALMALGGSGTIEADLHFLKGSAANLGFEAFRGLCAEGEAMAAAGRGNQVEIGRIIATYAASKHRFLDGLADRGAATRSA
jgi:HPt (histidine-containing phosphotransfer) domain-containing protein